MPISIMLTGDGNGAGFDLIEKSANIVEDVNRAQVLVGISSIWLDDDMLNLVSATTKGVAIVLATRGMTVIQLERVRKLSGFVPTCWSSTPKRLSTPLFAPFRTALSSQGFILTTIGDRRKSPK